MAERVGFEPTVRLPVQRFSRPSRSTTPAPLPAPASLAAPAAERKPRLHPSAGAAVALTAASGRRLFLDSQPPIPIVPANWRGRFAAPFGFSLKIGWFTPIWAVGPAGWIDIMFAVIRTGGKQYRVAPTDLVEVEKLSGNAGDAVAFGDVLMVGGDDGVAVGSPTVAGATVSGEIVGQHRTAKILVFKKRRRQNSRRSHGHRQELTLVRITEILTDGKAPAATAAAADETPAAPKRARAKKPAEAAPQAAADADQE